MNKNTTISSITIGPRQSNFELLRILAMFLVLVFHATFWSLGDPTQEDFMINPANAWTRTSIGAFSVICVNVFVLISGWFGIKPTLKGLCGYIFQWLFFYLGTFIVMASLGLVSFDLRLLLACFGLSNYNWFIKAYLALYIISPLLNAFVEKASKQIIRTFLIAFFVFQTLYGWSSSAGWISQGYSTFSFIGLYILSRYMRIYLTSNRLQMGGVFLISTLINIPVLAAQMFYSVGPGVHSYVNPLVITSSIGIFGWFSKLKMPTNKIVNYIAKSAFAVFLFHHAPAIGRPLFKPLINNIYQSFSGIECIMVILSALVIIFILAIFLDMPRRYIWNKIVKVIFKT